MPIYEHAPFCADIMMPWRHIEVRQHTHMELTDFFAPDAMTHWAERVSLAFNHFHHKFKLYLLKK